MKKALPDSALIQPLQLTANPKRAKINMEIRVDGFWWRYSPRCLWGCLADDSGERLNGIQEVSGSIPLISTKRVR